METNYYMVRAMTSSEQDFKAFFDNNVVAVGWFPRPIYKYKTSKL